MDSDDVDFVLTAICPFGAMSILVGVERVLASADCAAPIDRYREWRRYVARRQMIRSWLKIS
ncbi:hypothetical protein FPV16_21750 [Methylobacterium sp. W2]|uniref:hypothetical protein n=1 Tax=Methylobacterium sp. W2 TaxID=2598107 RepID=UPI001D0C6289|nr:hypothetical protein [Methylobacterium sp. W2]MCC0808797.1 hypothetical protein [Methylobacterium sp. W2]